MVKTESQPFYDSGLRFFPHNLPLGLVGLSWGLAGASAPPPTCPGERMSRNAVVSPTASRLSSLGSLLLKTFSAYLSIPGWYQPSATRSHHLQKQEPPLLASISCSFQLPLCPLGVRRKFWKAFSLGIGPSRIRPPKCPPIPFKPMVDLLNNSKFRKSIMFCVNVAQILYFYLPPWQHNSRGKGLDLSGRTRPRKSS